MKLGEFLMKLGRLPVYTALADIPVKVNSSFSNFDNLPMDNSAKDQLMHLSVELFDLAKEGKISLEVNLSETVMKLFVYKDDVLTSEKLIFLKKREPQL